MGKVRKILLAAIVLLIVALSGIWGYYFYRQYFSRPQLPPFAWGGVIRPFALKGPETQNYDPRPVIDQQFQLLQELGANSVRANYEGNPEIDDYLVAAAHRFKLPLILIVEGVGLNDFFKEANYQRGFQLGYQVASRYRGKIAVYQLGNEASGVTVKKDHPGVLESDYDDKKYAIFLAWLKGLAAGIKSADPDAKLMITVNWVGVGIVKRLAEDGLPFDIVGWNWYSEMGEITAAQYAKDQPPLDIPRYIHQLGKKFVVTEANLQGGSQGQEAEQAQFLAQFARQMKTNPYCSGFFVFPLTDLAGEQNQPTGHLGLVKVEKQNNHWIFGQKKPAFFALQKIIAQE